MSLSRVFTAGLLVIAAASGCLLPAARAQTTAFNDTFTGSSTINSSPASPAAPSVTGAAYQQLAAKTYNPNPPAISPGNLRFGIVSTSSGFNHVQALFTEYPVTLVDTGDYIELTVSFSTEGGIITPQTNSTLFFGLYNAGQVQPIPGGMPGTVATATTGYAQEWQGYVNRIFYAGGSNGFYTRPAKLATDANNQDVLYNYGGATVVGSTSTSALAAFGAGDSFTEVYRITKSGATTVTLASSLYAGTTASGTPLYTQESTSTSILTDTYDAFAFGWRATGSVASVMNVSSVKITTTGTTTIVPDILAQPFSLTKMVGESVELAVVADGGNGTALSYQWYKDGVEIAGATEATYAIASAALSDAGDYTVVVSNIAGSTTSDVATLTVTTGAVPPSIVTDPVGATVLVGGSHTFNVTANGTATLTYQWQFSNDAGANYGDISGATSDSFAIFSAQIADAGLYRVVVTNGVGSATSASAELVVNAAPVITTQPSDATLNPGDPLSLSVTATGTPAPTYQWLRNGVAIAGATDFAYSVGGVTGADAGSYTVVVTNSVGSVTSEAASVAVLSASMATTDLTPVTSASGLNPDTRLTITFNEVVTPGVSGVLRIHDASDDSVVDTIDLVAATALRDSLRAASTLSTQLLPVQSKPIGGIANDFHYYPITVSGDTATIHPRNGVLGYGKTYYVTITPGVFVNASGESFAGISDPNTWRFSTKSSGPAAGTTTLFVAADGSGDFDTIQAALDFIPAGNITPTTILIGNGTYFEEVGFQQKHFVTILGEDADQTIITYPNNNTFNNVSGIYHRAVMVAQSVHDFTIANLTIHNTTPQNGSQAEAIVINGSGAASAHNVVTRCRFYSYQDTVLFNKQTYISDTIIHGDVDFMWGDGPAFFENCDIRILRAGGYFTQIRNDSSRHGFVFKNCRFTAPAGITGTFFGRIDPAFFPYSEVVILDSVLGDTDNNAFLNTTTGVSGSSYRASWWLLNNASSATTAPNVRNWSSGLVDANGAAINDGNGDTFTGMPADAATQANYRDPVWVLNTSLDGTVNGTWSPVIGPVIVSHPVSQAVAVGDPVVFEVAAIAIPSATYQWRKDEVDIPGATSASFSIAAAAIADAGVYTVVVTNAAGTTTSDPALLEVGTDAVPPVITSQPEGATVTAGDTVIFTVAASGSVPLAYQWYKDGIEIIGATSDTYTIPAAALTDAGGYTVIVSNDGGSDTSDPAVLSVLEPAAGTLVDDTFADGNSQNEDLANGSLRLFNGRSANTRTDAVGSTTFSIISTSSEGFWAHFTEAGDPVSLAVGDSLTVEVDFSVSGFGGTGQEIRFGVLDSAGTRNATNLTGGMNSGVFADDLGYAVRYIASTSSTPFTLLKRNPVGSTANPNNPFNSTGTSDWSVLTEGATGTSEIASLANSTTYTLAYSIHRTTETDTIVEVEVTGGSLPAAYGSIAMDTATTHTAFDYFGFRIANASFASAVSFTRLHVTVERAAPEIVTQPVFSNGDSTLSLPVSGSTVLSVEAAGAGLSYQWFKDGAPIAGATLPSLEFFNVQLGDAGDYFVVVSNAGGFLTSESATLTVTGGLVAPTIVVEPVDTEIAEGGNGALSVVAIGTTPFSYQWFKDGSPIPGATADTHMINNAAMSDAGGYSVVVTNDGGGATSLIADVTVKGIAAIVHTGYAAAVTGGAAGSTVTVSNAADLKAYAETIDTPYTIVVAGVIDLGENGRIKLQSNKTLRGATTSSTILGTINISNANNVIVSNLNISANTGAPSTNDGVTVASSTNVLVTKCTIYDCTDGNLDVINGSDLVTVSWCRFYYTRDNGHNFSNLVGSSDTDVGSGDGLTNYRVTWHHNWWSTGAKQRMLACRFGSAHMFNNYWNCVGNDYCTESRNIASIFSEHNYYDGVKDPLNKRDALVTDVGLLMTIDNIFNNCTGSQLVSNDLVFTPPYSYGLYANSSVPAMVMAGAGNVTTDAPVGFSASISGPAAAATVGAGFTLTAAPAGFTLTAAPAGFTPTSYQWRLNNFAIPGATSATYENPSAQMSDAGVYTVVLGLADGDAVVSAPFVLAVEVAPEPPVVTTDPASQSATVGDSVSFTVVATGDAPLEYQWRKYGVDIAGATGATLELSAITTADAGEYDCVVTNGAGSATSAAATLTVEKAAATVTVESASVTYDGAARSVTVTTVPAGLALEITYGGSTAQPVSAGSYAVVATVVDADYSGAGSGFLVINPAAAAVTLSDLVHTYDGNPHAATVATDPAGLPVLVTYDGGSVAPTGAGSYAVVATVTDPNHTGETTGTLTIEKAGASLTLSGLWQMYDGTPRMVTADTTPAGLAVTITYDGSGTPPVYPGSYEVVAHVDDPNHESTVTATLEIGVTALVRHAPVLNGDIDGSVQVLSGSYITMNSHASIAGDLLVPGMPAVQINGQPAFVGTIDGPGADQPANYAVTLNRGSVLRHLVRRIDPIEMEIVDAPPAPAGTRDVTLNNPAASPGDFATLRNLTLNGNAGKRAVPPGTYGWFTANGNSGFVLGIPGATEPAIYNLQGLTLNGHATIEIVGPVVLTLANGTSLNGIVGSADAPEWLLLRIAAGGLTLNSGADVHGSVVAPSGTVTINGGCTLAGTVVADRLTLNHNGLLADPATVEPESTSKRSRDRRH